MCCSASKLSKHRACSKVWRIICAVLIPSRGGQWSTTEGTAWLHFSWQVLSFPMFIMQTQVPQVFCELTMASPSLGFILNNPNTSACLKMTWSFGMATEGGVQMPKSQHIITTFLNKDKLDHHVGC